MPSEVDEETAKGGILARHRRRRHRVGDYDRLTEEEEDDAWQDETPTGRSGNRIDKGNDGLRTTLEEESPSSLLENNNVVSFHSHDDDGSSSSGSSNSGGLPNQNSNRSIWNTCLLPDDRFSIVGVSLVDGPPVVKLLKFVAVTLAFICIMHAFIRAVVSQRVSLSLFL